MLNKSLDKASSRDSNFFNQIVRPDGIEYSGYNTQLDRDGNKAREAPKTFFVFGPLLDYPPSLPDTVLTTMLNLTRSHHSFGMKFAHICMDIQLYMIGC